MHARIAVGDVQLLPVTLIAISRMHRRDCAAIVENITNALPDVVLEEIVTKTDGS